MGSWARNAFVIAFLFSQAARGSEPALPLTLRIYDNADVPVKALDQAKREVRRIFSKAGIEALWLDCKAAEPRDPPCVQKPQPADLIIRIVSRTSTSGTGQLFGLAIVTAEGFSQYATIFMARYGPAPTATKSSKVVFSDMPSLTKPATCFSGGSAMAQPES